jgi:hypothetical protein
LKSKAETFSSPPQKNPNAIALGFFYRVLHRQNAHGNKSPRSEKMALAEIFSKKARFLI